MELFNKTSCISGENFLMSKNKKILMFLEMKLSGPRLKRSSKEFSCPKTKIFLIFS